jgi:hypothetical protein
MADHRSDIVAFRSGLLYEADMVADALSEAGVPFYRRSEVLGGPEFAMPVAASPGPGTVRTVLVPAQSSSLAASVIESLPVTHVASPGAWSFNPKPRAKQLLIIGSAILLALWLIPNVLQTLACVAHISR